MPQAVHLWTGDTFHTVASDLVWAWNCYPSLDKQFDDFVVVGVSRQHYWGDIWSEFWKLGVHHQGWNLYKGINHSHISCGTAEIRCPSFMLLKWHHNKPELLQHPLFFKSCCIHAHSHLCYSGKTIFPQIMPICLLSRNLWWFSSQTAVKASHIPTWMFPTCSEMGVGSHTKRWNFVRKKNSKRPR